MLRHCTAEVISEKQPKAWVTPRSPKHTLHPFQGLYQKLRKEPPTHRAPCMIYIYIYNCSHFIVLNSLFTVDLTQALNNCRDH